MRPERDAGGVLATIGAWLGAAAMVVAALLVLPFTGGPRLPMSPRTAPVTITTPTTPPTPITTPTTPPPSVATPATFQVLHVQAVKTAESGHTPPPATQASSRAILEPPAPVWPTVCGPITIGLADGPLDDPGTELELEGAGGITVLTDVGTLEGDGINVGACVG